MRVLQVIGSMSPFHGGPTYSMIALEQTLKFYGVCSELVTTDDDGPGRRFTSPFLMNQLPIKSEVSTPVRRYFAKRTEFYVVAPGLAWWLVRHLRNYDLVHIHGLFSFCSIAAALIARFLGVPYIIEPMGTLMHYGLRTHRPRLKQFSISWLEGPILRNAVAVRFNTEAEREQAETLRIPMRSVVIPHAVKAPPTAEPVEFVKRFPELVHGNYLIFIGRLDPIKNLEGLLGAIAILISRFPDLRLLIVGDGQPEYVALLKELALSLNIDSQLVWAGFVDGHLKASALAGAKVFVLPSYSENFSVAAAEALLAGLPCVLGQGVAIASDVTRSGSGIAVAPEPEDIAVGIAAAWTAGVAEYALMSGNAVALARDKFSDEVLGRALVALYESSVAFKPRH